MREAPDIKYHELSILIPTFNDECDQLVVDLCHQLQPYPITWEIIVADDASTNMKIRETNHYIQQYPHCQYIERTNNVGRAGIRNFLAHQAHYEWLLFIDSDMRIPTDYMIKYLTCEEADVVDGGIKIIPSCQKGNLRCLHELRTAKKHTLKYRLEHPYQDFHTANFLIRRQIMLTHPFDERFVKYGYEDVLFGKSLQDLHIPILHIDNPTFFEIFEDNASFVDKTEEGLRTLYQFREELKDYSHMIEKIDRLRNYVPLALIRLWHRLMGTWERQSLIRYPNLRIFDLYRLGYYLCLKDTIRE